MFTWKTIGKLKVKVGCALEASLEAIKKRPRYEYLKRKPQPLEIWRRQVELEGQIAQEVPLSEKETELNKQIYEVTKTQAQKAEEIAQMTRLHRSSFQVVE
jgi:hypothetical protein